MPPLYPLLFTPTPFERIWGGDYIAKNIHSQFPAHKKIGESWELCGLEGCNSVVCNGFLMDNEINELIEVYMGDLIGDRLYQKFGCEFPLMVKILDINDYLSFQVHPSDEIALTRHNAYGKAEVWYILHAEPDAAIFLGFNRQMNEAELRARCVHQTLPEVMNQYTPHPGDCFYIPPGTVHAAGGGLVVAEIQQVSDVTYRIYDWGREFLQESAREMHLELAMDAINWEAFEQTHVPQQSHIPQPSPLSKPLQNNVEKLLETPYFHLYKRLISTPVHLSNTFGSSFRLLLCTEGEIKVTANESVCIKKGGVTLIPAAVTQYTIEPMTGGKEKRESEREHDEIPSAEVLEAFLP